MNEYIPTFSKEKRNAIVLDNVFAVEECIEYAKTHNYNVVMAYTSSTKFAEILMLFQKNGFNHKLYEYEVCAIDGTQLNPEIHCLFERNKRNEMSQFDKIKKDITEIEKPMELAGCLDGIRFAATVYCRENYPDEVIWENGKIEDITVYGMCRYLESKAD